VQKRHLTHFENGLPCIPDNAAGLDSGITHQLGCISPFCPFSSKLYWRGYMAPDLTCLYKVAIWREKGMRMKN
jgi:hypothetical protein